MSIFPVPNRLAFAHGPNRRMVLRFHLSDYRLRRGLLATLQNLQQIYILHFHTRIIPSVA